MIKAYSIYGPPGTGKTSEMLKRVEMAKGKYNPSRICFLSFTKAGAAEALTRLGLKRSDKICTIHSMMYRLLGFHSSSVVDGYKLKKFGERSGFIFNGASNDTGDQMGIGDQYLSVLSSAINKCTNLKEEYYNSDRPGNISEFSFFCSSYMDWKEAHGLVDFNDMLTAYLVNPVSHESDVIFIDEAQDLSNLQWSVIRAMLAFEYVKEVHVAGDPDQNIFEWSGSSTHGMLEFEEKYQAKRVILGQSFRIPRLVHGKAVEIINRIDNRVKSEYLPRNEVGILRRSNFLDIKSIVPGEDTLILCRNFMSKRSMEEELIRHRIPYTNSGGAPGLFESKIANAIKVFRKLEDGNPVTQGELDRMMSVCDNRTKSDILSKDFTPMLKRGFLRSLIIPSNLIEFYRDVDVNAEPSVRLSTIHAAKGREAHRVILNTRLTQRTLTSMDRNPDPETRTWYVAITRAKHTLDIIEDEMGFNL